MTYNKLNSLLKTNTEINYITDHDSYIEENNIDIKQFKNNEFILFEYTTNMLPTIKLLTLKLNIMTKLTKKRFVISKSLIGKNVVITFTNKKGETYSYNHDDVYSVNQERLETMECFQKYGNYTNSNNLPKWCRNLQIK